MKSIFEILASLGTGAVLLGGCGSAQPPAEVPAAVEIKPAAEAPANEVQKADSSGGIVDVNQNPNPAPAAPQASVVAAPSALPSVVANAGCTPDPCPKKDAGKPKPAKGVAVIVKKPAAGGCGDGTCGDDPPKKK